MVAVGEVLECRLLRVKSRMPKYGLGRLYIIVVKGSKINMFSMAVS